MAKAINHPLYSAKKLSCDAPIPTVANIPAMIGIPNPVRYQWDGLSFAEK